LLTVVSRPELQPVQCLLAAWGYNLPEERENLRRRREIQVIDLTRFRELCGS